MASVYPKIPGVITAFPKDFRIRWLPLPLIISTFASQLIHQVIPDRPHLLAAESNKHGVVYILYLSKEQKDVDSNRIWPDIFCTNEAMYKTQWTPWIRPTNSWRAGLVRPSSKPVRLHHETTVYRWFHLEVFPPLPHQLLSTSTAFQSQSLNVIGNLGTSGKCTGIHVLFLKRVSWFSEEAQDEDRIVSYY